MRAFVLMRQQFNRLQRFERAEKLLEREMNRTFNENNEALPYLLSPKSKPTPIGFKIKGKWREKVFRAIKEKQT